MPSADSGLLRGKELCHATAVELGRALRSKQVSAREIMRAHLDQIGRLNPIVNAIVTLVAEDRLLADAAAADEAAAKGRWLGPLHGLPVSQKDLTPTKGVRTTMGSPIFKHHVPETDALIVERCRAAGAIMLGKTNTPEFGAGSQTYNAVFGPTLNPWNLERTCGGSSGGAAVSLACGMNPLACGSDMGGSLRNPAAWNNVVGFRPSPGRVPKAPALNGWATLGVDGPMARTVADVALLLSVIAGPTDQSPIAIAEPGALFARLLKRNFRGVRVAMFDTMGGLPIDPEIRATVSAQRAVLEDLGCIVEIADPDFTDFEDVFRNERASIYGARLAPFRSDPEKRATLKPELLSEIARLDRLTALDLALTYVQKTRIFQRMRGFMSRYEFYVLPVTQVHPFPVTQSWPTEIGGVQLHSYIDWMRSCWCISVTGQPALSVPCGFSADGMPIGMQIVGRHRDDWGVLQLGHAYEGATGHGRRRPPLAG